MNWNLAVINLFNFGCGMEIFNFNFIEMFWDHMWRFVLRGEAWRYFVSIIIGEGISNYS